MDQHLLSTYTSNVEGNSHAKEVEYISSESDRFMKQKFDQKTTALSPQFDKIYNQALAVETSDLDKISGLGYRKDFSTSVILILYFILYSPVYLLSNFLMN